jgi:predicted ATP-grasp superfamily ATP-dependent carboligase
MTFFKLPTGTGSTRYQKSILLIGYDTNLCLGVLYCLRKENYKIYLLTGNKNNAARYSRFLTEIFYQDESDQLAHILEIINQKSIDLVMPIDEMEIRFISANKEVLAEKVKCSWTTDPHWFDIGINKRLLAEFLTEHNIPCPRFATVSNKDDLMQVSKELGFPILIKPNRGSFGRMIRRFEDFESLNAYYQEFDDNDHEFILQPFIIGSDITCNVICKQGEIICHTIQESPVKTGSDFSSNDVLEFHEDANVIDVVGRMMAGLKWNGVACVDIRRNHANGSINILEINGRFWASVVSSYLKAGLNFPLIMVRLAFGEPVSIPKPRKAKQISIQQYKESFFQENIHSGIQSILVIFRIRSQGYFRY